MKGPVVLLLGVCLVFTLVTPGFSWDGIDHQLIYSLAVSLASNDGGTDFAKAKAILEKYEGTMKKAVIAPDVDYKLAKPSIYSPQIICQPIYPPLYHAHDAMMHVGFDGLVVDDSERRAVAYGQRAIQKWLKGDIEGALYDLGCIMHLLQDAAFCGHSNLGFFTHIGKHSAFEGWVLKQTTTDGKTPKSWEKLFEEGWTINYGGVYLKEPWKDEAGREHWAGGLESWIDVAAHLAYRHATVSLTLDYTGCEFNGQARQQFVNAERVSAGLLVDFFRQVGVIRESLVYYRRGGEIWRVRLGAQNPEKVQGPIDAAAIWPKTSPDGKSFLGLFSVDTVDRVNDIYITVSHNTWNWEFDRLEWKSVPKKLGKAFYINNYFVALIDANEGDNWRHLYLIPAIPRPDNGYDCFKGGVQYFFDGPEEMQRHQVEVVDLP